METCSMFVTTFLTNQFCNDCKNGNYTCIHFLRVDTAFQDFQRVALCQTSTLSNGAPLDLMPFAISCNPMLLSVSRNKKEIVLIFFFIQNIIDCPDLIRNIQSALNIQAVSTIFFYISDIRRKEAKYFVNTSCLLLQNKKI